MLRVTIQDDARGAAFKLEGKLAHEWVVEAERAWNDFSSFPHGERVVVDLCGVSFVDDAGRALLARMHAFGAKLVGTGPMTSALIEEICGDSRPRVRRWMRGLVGLFFMFMVSAVPRKEGVLDFVRGIENGHFAYGIPNWIFTLLNQVVHIWKGIA